MSSGAAITVKYWISSDTRSFVDLEGIDEFRHELAADYISVVEGRRAGAGGFTHLYVEFVSSLSLSHLIQLLLDGISFDLVKKGAEIFVLRPFLESYRKLRDRNKGERNSVDIGELQIQFQDGLLVIHEVWRDSLVDQLEGILRMLARNYQSFVLESGDRPFVIHIPVFEDPDPERPCRFRVRGFVDETILGKAPDDYFKFWGLEYDVFRTRVYDLTNRMLLDEEFNTLERHGAELTRRFELKYRDEFKKK